MTSGWLEALKSYFSTLNELCVEGELETLDSLYLNKADRKKEKDLLARGRAVYSRRNARPLKSKTTIRDLTVIREEERTIELLLELARWKLYEIGGRLLEQEEEQIRRLTMKKMNGEWFIASDQTMNGEGNVNSPRVIERRSGRDAPAPNWTRSENERQPAPPYDRAKAKRYAELWWDRYNPEYPQFDVDCANFVSQCLRAGGLPLDDTGDRAKGWWHRGAAEWSFSWSVARSLRLYFINPQTKNGSRAEVKNRPEELMIGDFICYDWDGDGRYQHATIVVAKDPNGMPLVNAHTDNSRHRYWEYRDSYAWTEKTKYTFIHIKG